VTGIEPGLSAWESVKSPKISPEKSQPTMRVGVFKDIRFLTKK